MTDRNDDGPGFPHRWCCVSRGCYHERARGAFMALGMVGLAVVMGELAIYVAYDSYGGDKSMWPTARDDWHSQQAVDILKSMVQRPREGCE